jgi:succinate-semialdehyde dehydrogenase/glutarate-semialdehyde dehydrogenase
MTATEPVYPTVQLFINGQWVPSASGRTIPVINPASGEKTGEGCAHSAE